MIDLHFALGTALVIVSVMFHIAGLILTSRSLLVISVRSNSFRPVRRQFLLLTVALFAIVSLHTAEGWAWAAVYYLVGEFDSFSTALYFSFVTSTTLGYGDITLSPEWQLFGTFESMAGLILFGASTAFLIEVNRRVFFDDGSN